MNSFLGLTLTGRSDAIHWWDWYWLTWLGNLWLLFLPVEIGVILANHPEMTLSNTMWDWTGDHRGQQWQYWHYTWPHWALIGFFVLMTLHLCFRVPLAPWHWGDKGVWPW